MCLCWSGKEYGCNPKAITDAMASQHLAGSKFEVWYAFVNPTSFVSQLPEGVHAVNIGGLKYFRLLLTSHFIISNTRFGGGMFWPMPKRKGQLYILTGHGSNGVKRIEFDTSSLPEQYLKDAMADTMRIDLMLSNSRQRTATIRSAYRYEGEILDCGFPRNDALINAESAASDRHYLLYTPTFRNNGRTDVYGFDFDKVISALETRFGGQWFVRISSHPNMRSFYQSIYDFSHPRLVDIGKEELQPYLSGSDALITDYSSAEMDFSLTGRPVFQLCRDRQDYDRGFYIKPEELPFPYAETDEQLVQNILGFDEAEYATDLQRFNQDVVGLHETGRAAEAVVEWMCKRYDK